MLKENTIRRDNNELGINIKNIVYRNKHSKKIYSLLGYDMVQVGNTTYQYAILVNENGKESKIEQKFLDKNYDILGEE